MNKSFVQKTAKTIRLKELKRKVAKGIGWSRKKNEANNEKEEIVKQLITKRSNLRINLAEQPFERTPKEKGNCSEGCKINKQTNKSSHTRCLRLFYDPLFPFEDAFSQHRKCFGRQFIVWWFSDLIRKKINVLLKISSFFRQKKDSDPSDFITKRDCVGIITSSKKVVERAWVRGFVNGHEMGWLDNCLCLLSLPAFAFRQIWWSLNGLRGSHEFSIR